ncbi:MAG TPA: uroporphyrinogen-III synthase [Candidatus Binatia bacterium]|nr:uroporphyrinogen-III synthase [Candidatus Binatia bacterium]
MSPPGALAGLRVVVFEARRATEVRRMLAHHGAEVVSVPALREVPLESPEAAHELARRLERGQVGCVVLLTGVGTRALAAACPELPARLAGVPLVARGPKPLAALRELGVAGAHPVPSPHTWRETLGVVDGLGLARGALVAVQEYGIAPARLLAGLEERGLGVLRVPVYRWAPPADPGPLAAAAALLARGAAQIAVFTSAAQVEHLARAAANPGALRAGMLRTLIASIGPVTSEALEAHGLRPDLEASPPKLGALVALLAERARAVLATKT